MATTPKKKTSRKAAAVAATPKLILTKAGAIGRKKDDGKLTVKGHEKTAAKMRERQEQIDSLTAEQKADKETIIGKMRELRVEKEKQGEFFPTLLLESDDGKPVPVIFQDKYQKVDVQHKAALQSALGDHFDTLVSSGVDIKFRKDVDIEMLKSKLGEEAFAVLEGMVDFTPYLKFTSGFMERRAALRRSMGADLNDTLDELVVQVQADPQIRLK